MLPAITANQVESLGTRGSFRNRSPVSSSNRSRLTVLHRRQAATTFSQVCCPPRLRGTTWSTDSARDPQYWQRCPSRCNTPRRLKPRRWALGTCTYRHSLTTDGSSNSKCSERKIRPVAWTVSARSPRTSTTARWLDTTDNGSSVTFRTRDFATDTTLVVGVQTLPWRSGQRPLHVSSPDQPGHHVSHVRRSVGFPVLRQ